METNRYIISDFSVIRESKRWFCYDVFPKSKPFSIRFEPSSSSSSSNGVRNPNSRPAPFAVEPHHQVGPDLDHPQQVDHHDEWWWFRGGFRRLMTMKMVIFKESEAFFIISILNFAKTSAALQCHLFKRSFLSWSFFLIFCLSVCSVVRWLLYIQCIFCLQLHSHSTIQQSFLNLDIKFMFTSFGA